MVVNFHMGHCQDPHKILEIKYPVTHVILVNIRQLKLNHTLELVPTSNNFICPSKTHPAICLFPPDALFRHDN